MTIVLYGPAGAGKTCLARALWVEMAIANVPRVRRDEFIYPARVADDDDDRIYVDALYCTTFDLAKSRREHRLGDGEAALVADAMSTRLLLLDELGAELGRGDSVVEEVVFERHQNERQTIMCTPFRMTELADRYSDGIARRIFESATVITLGSVKR
ncbi:MAG TPA: hypothetical protein VK540_26765 [Polyangiaceae bacterium]|nr:hypothetical protein [Polyangiaceae bacterium]